jgi:glutamate-ammonia-ligase adenylyltransferase
MESIHRLSESLSKEIEETWGAFCAAADAAAVPIPDDPAFQAEMKRVWAFSEFVSKCSISDPAMILDLYGSGDLKRRYSENAFDTRFLKCLTGVDTEDILNREIRRLRQREMVRIAWRDLAGLADVSETMTALSLFADTCISHVLDKLYQWQCEASGVPLSEDRAQQFLVVIGLGKLGGNELNFSSDVDLVFAYPEAGVTVSEGGSPSIQNEEFFVRLCRKLIKTIGSSPVEGMLFRVDTRLRPFGESGPIVMSFDNMVQYYEMQGREWERYAWIKGRVVAGDKDAGQQLLQRLKPFVYRRYLDYGAFDSLREMKQMISREVKRKGYEENIKLGPGGIREVEFFGQIFQLIRGGVVPVLQERRIQRVLRTLAREGAIPRNVTEELETAYLFLRKSENRLQEFSDRQTHSLPRESLARYRLALSMDYSDWESYASDLSSHMQQVHHHFETLLETKETQQDEEAGVEPYQDIWSESTPLPRKEELLSEFGFNAIDQVIGLLDHLKADTAAHAMSREGRERLDRLMPLILRQVRESEDTAHTLTRIVDLIRSIQRRTNYLALLLENPDALEHLVKLTNASPWIISFLTRHPVLLDELLDPRTLYTPPKRAELEADLQKKRVSVPERDLEYQIEDLCVFKQVNTLRVAAADITGVLPLMRVSDHLSDLAVTILSEVVELAWEYLVSRHGEPKSRLNEIDCGKGFAVIAYGKLGGLELGYDSDLDLVFLHAGTEGETEGGTRPIDNAQFYARLGQRVVHILTTHTGAGYLYETDMRLRPSGGSGPLVSHVEGFEAYQSHEAWTWEHQALVRARAVFGDPLLIDHFDGIRRKILTRFRDKGRSRKDVLDMRERLRKGILKATPGMFDLRQDRGGMVDIEFLVQFLLLSNAHRKEELTTWTDNVRILKTLSDAGVIDDNTAHLLRDAYLIFRSALHRLSLKEQPALVPDTQFGNLRDKIIDIWNHYMAD